MLEGILHIEQFKSRMISPAKVFLWRVTLLHPSVFMLDPISTYNLRGITTQFPGVGSTDMDLYYMGQITKYIGTVEYDHTWYLEVYESEYGDMHKLFYDLKNIVSYNQDLGILNTMYKMDIYVEGLISSSPIGIPWIKFILKGAYLKAIPTLDVDRGNNTEPVRWRLEFNYDWWTKDRIPVPPIPNTPF